MRRYKRRKKQRKIVVVSLVSLLCIMTAGYAAFQTNLNISAKGNIINKGIQPSDLLNNIVTSGDGLYKDMYEENRYIYRGGNPDNYIKFNDELWRIVSLENDGALKIIRKDSIDNMVFDPGYETLIEGVTDANSVIGTRYSSNSTDYCYYNSGVQSDYNGCNIWGSRTTMLDKNGVNITKMPRFVNGTTTYNLPEKEAYINIYLNDNFYSSLDEITKSKITTHKFNVGILNYESNQTLGTDIIQEKAYTWKGKVGLANASDYVRASTDTSCTSAYAGNQSPYPCNNGNFLFELSGWTMSPSQTSYSANAWATIYYGRLSPIYGVFGTNSVRPVLYLKSDIYLNGNGTYDDPYTIVN